MAVDTLTVRADGSEEVGAAAEVGAKGAGGMLAAADPGVQGGADAEAAEEDRAAWKEQRCNI